MKKYIHIVIMTVTAISIGVFAQQGGVSGSAAKADSAPAVQQAPQSPQRSLNKQASVNRPTKKTNWSKIKTLFE